MGPEKHAGGEPLVLEAERGPDADAVGQAPPLLHPADAAVQPPLLPAGAHHALYPVHLNVGPAGKRRLRLAQVFEKTGKVMGLPLLVNPANLSVVHPLVELLPGEVGNVLPHPGQSLVPGIGVVRRGAQHHLPLSNHTVAQALGNVRTG